MNKERIKSELDQLQGRQEAALVIGDNGHPYVLYTNVLVTSSLAGIPRQSNVIVPVPPGYPADAIDLAGLPLDSPLLRRVKGQPNGGIVTVNSIAYQIFSYHPHGNAGGGAWDQTRHGFHTYFDWLLTWLACLA